MRLNTVQLSRMDITDPFWKQYTDLVEDVIIPYQWDIMNDNVPGVESSHCLENFKIAAGLKKGQFYGAVFQDTDVAKWLEAVGYSLAEKKNEKLEKLADDAIDVIVQAQQEDGYLDTYFIIKEPSQRWRNLCEGHELYSAGHMIEAAVAYYEGTGKRKLLDSMIRLADLICRTFGPEEGQNHGYPGHQEIELALVRLYRVTQDKKYLEQAKYFLDIRGAGKNYFLEERKQENFKRIFPEFEDYDPAYSQSHEPVREQKTAEGHAVRAVYMYSAMADVAEEYQDKELMEACVALWENITQKRMYITGGIGSSGFLERFTTDYDLPNDSNYSETCASIGMALFSLRMANITRNSRYAELCTHLWMHYRYTKNLVFLREAFPVMAEAALFFVDYLEEKDGYLVTNPSVSPENTYILPNGQKGCCCIGATMDNQILRDLFKGCLGAWKELGEQVPEACEIPEAGDIKELMGTIRKMYDRLPPNRIGSDGRLMEWMEEYEETEPGHRHISHLYGLYPAGEITADGTPELAEACRKTLEYRLSHGGGHTGWSRAWITNHYVSLWNAEAAYDNIRKMLEVSTYPNLLDKHPPFQIDGNFGICAAMNGMLVQSNEERILLLPALPAAWKTGAVRGMHLIGNLELSMSWKDGRITGAVFTAYSDVDTVVKYKETEKRLQLKEGEIKDIMQY